MQKTKLVLMEKNEMSFSTSFNLNNVFFVIFGKLGFKRKAQSLHEVESVSHYASRVEIKTDVLEKYEVEYNDLFI